MLMLELIDSIPDEEFDVDGNPIPFVIVEVV
jgi:hypothetical protein